MKTSVTVKICDWEKFNPRTDSKNHSWFRFENGFFTKTFSWSAEEQRLFTYLCCVYSQEKKDTINLNLSLASALLKRKPQQINADLKTLESYGVVTLSNFELLDVTQSQLVPTYVRTNDTNDTNDTNVRMRTSALPLLAVLWNEHSEKALPKVKECSQSRIAAAKKRWEEHPDPEYWKSVILKISESKFCTGSNNRGWKANFDFFVRPDTHIKALEGTYDSHANQKNDVNWDLVFKGAQP